MNIAANLPGLAPPAVVAAIRTGLDYVNARGDVFKSAGCDTCSFSCVTINETLAPNELIELEIDHAVRTGCVGRLDRPSFRLRCEWLMTRQAP